MDAICYDSGRKTSIALYFVPGQTRMKFPSRIFRCYGYFFHFWINLFSFVRQTPMAKLWFPGSFASCQIPTTANLNSNLNITEKREPIKTFYLIINPNHSRKFTTMGGTFRPFKEAEIRKMKINYLKVHISLQVLSLHVAETERRTFPCGRARFREGARGRDDEREGKKLCSQEAGRVDLRRTLRAPPLVHPVHP